MPRDAAMPIPMLKQPETATGGTARFLDRRFEQLMGANAWAALPSAVRRRFARKAGPGESVIYSGIVTDLKATRLGHALAHVARLIGGPLPTSRALGAASVVTVTEDAAGGGQTWSRLYARRSGFPQIIHSAKRFAGPTGLEEYVGHGVGMTLTVHGEPDALVFRSDRYFVEAFGRRVYLPSWMTPGALTVRHRQISGPEFAFELSVRHRIFGQLLFQKAIFEEISL